MVDRIVINNIDEEEDENIDVDSDKVVAKEIEYHPEVVVNPPRQMNKSLSELSNIGNRCNIKSFCHKYDLHPLYTNYIILLYASIKLMFFQYRINKHKSDREQ